ncbi:MULTISPECIES: ABC transporter permease [Streptomyces]|uniref:ABC transporter permease n=1 Tax=Streptomyces TaxID=1883 RepID=UPI001D1418C3|nr:MULTISPECIES: ABC transporter permease [Streptomyces]MCC3652092.1 ABC transporter permease [Streptomyces sp. S07_1.15]WSQ73209.1 ABC transporter permease [Streptomyces xinghaiensis]
MSTTTPAPQGSGGTAAPAAGSRAAIDWHRVGLGVAAPLLAIVAALAITSLIFLTTGDNPFRAFSIMVEYGSKSDSQIVIVNKAIPYFLSALAVAIGFRMNLFNIGVDGQYRIAAFFAAVVGGALALPGIIQIPVIMIVAMMVGALWSGIAGLLKTTRGVSEVISTIMLNAIAGAIIGYFLQDGRLAVRDGNIIHTEPIPESAHFFEIPTGQAPVNGFIVVAVIVGVLYWFLLNRTRFGFDLRTVGRSESAAQAGGVSVGRMVVTSMLLSGLVAGLVGMPTLLGESYNFGTDFPNGIGFTGIAIALLGRNHPVGIALGALLWGFLERTGGRLEFEGYAQEIVGVMQGVIVLCVVIAYEVVRRYGLRTQQRKVGERLAAEARDNGKTEKAEVSA